MSALEAITPEPLAEEGADVAVEAPVATPVNEDVIDVIESRTEPIERVLSYGGATTTYRQEPLKYFRKIEFFGLVGETIDSAMEGEDGLTLNTLLGGGGPSSVAELTSSDFGDLDSFLSLVAKIAHHAPDFLKNCYLIWLNVPKHERTWAREALDQIDDDAGEDIIATFIDQNWASMEHFFVERLPSLGRRVADQRKKD